MNGLLLTPLWQRDPRWAATKIGVCQDLTIGSHGCLMTCFAMLSGLLPPDVNSKMVKANLIGDCANALTFDIRKFVSNTAPRLEYVSSPFRDINRKREIALAPATRSIELPDEIVARTDMLIREGRGLAIFEVSTAAYPKFSQHFVLAVSVYGHGPGVNFVINDPLTGKQMPLCPTYKAAPKFGITRAILYAY